MNLLLVGLSHGEYIIKLLIIRQSKNSIPGSNNNHSFLLKDTFMMNTVVMQMQSQRVT